jgi:hypothetical protein
MSESTSARSHIDEQASDADAGRIVYRIPALEDGGESLLLFEEFSKLFGTSFVKE